MESCQIYLDQSYTECNKWSTIFLFIILPMIWRCKDTKFLIICICMSIFICPLDRRGIEVRLSRVEWSVIHKFHMLSYFIILFRIICKESRWSIYVYNTLLYCNMYMCGFGFMLLHKFKIIFSFWRRPDLNPNPKFRWGWGILTQKQYWTLTQCSNKWKRAPKLSYYIYIISLKISLNQELLF